MLLLLNSTEPIILSIVVSGVGFWKVGERLNECRVKLLPNLVTLTPDDVGLFHLPGNPMSEG